VLWKGEPIGSVADVSMDMWYLEFLWIPDDSEVCRNFHQAIAHLQGKTFWSLTLPDMVWVQIPEMNMNCWVVHVPVNNRITFHLVTNHKPPQS